MPLATGYYFPEYPMTSLSIMLESVALTRELFLDNLVEHSIVTKFKIIQKKFVLKIKSSA